MAMVTEAEMLAQLFQTLVIDPFENLNRPQLFEAADGTICFFTHHVGTFQQEECRTAAAV